MLIENLKEPKDAAEYRFKINTDDFKAYGESVIDKLEQYAAANGWDIADDNREGIRVSLCGGWFLLRLSVHDPIMPLNIESDNEGGVKTIAEKLTPFFADFDALDTECLKA